MRRGIILRAWCRRAVAVALLTTALLHRPTKTPTPVLGFAFVQSKAGFASGTSNAQSFSSTPTAGNLIIAAAWAYVGSTFTLSCADNQSNSYTQDVTKMDSGPILRCSIFSARAATASGTFTVTVTASASASINVCIAEFSGTANPVATDGTSSANGSGNSAAPGSITTTVAGDLMISVLASGSGSTNAGVVVPTNYTSLDIRQNGNTDVVGGAAYRILIGTSTENATWAINNDSQVWATGEAAYKPGAGGGGGKLFRDANLCTGAGGPFFVQPLS